MTSINYNIPTRTNYVPTTTQQPTNTNTTASAGGASSTGSSVPTPTSSIVYTAKAPVTTDPRLTSLKSQLSVAQAKVDEIEAEFLDIRRQMSAIYSGCDSNASDSALKEYFDEGKITEDQYNKLKTLSSKLNEVQDKLDAAMSEVSNLKSQIKELESQQTTQTGGVLTFTGGAPTDTTPPRITSTTGNVPYYPTVS